MAVRYIQVQTVSNLFSPAVRAYGNIAIIGAATVVDKTVPSTLFTAPPDIPPGKSAGDLENAITTAFKQTPGPTIIYGIPVATTKPDWAAAFNTASTLPVQLVVLANTPVPNAGVNAGDPLQLLSDHVTMISNLDGRERIGVAMLTKGSTKVSAIMVSERMVYIAHKSDQDAAAAVAGTIAGYEPPVSLLLKPVNIQTGLFTPSDIATLNGAENFTSGPNGQGVNWLTSPALLPGGAIYMGEGYTGNPGGGKKFIDIVRTIDDISFKLKARLIQSIGVLRISRAGLRTVIGLLEAVLEPYVRGDVLGSYDIKIPILLILDKDPIIRTAAENQILTDAQAKRLIEVQVTVKYQAAIHRLSITLKLD